MAEVTMPRLSDSMEEGTILKWLKSDGDEVAKGEELVEIETDKANMTYEAEAEGTLEIVAKEGDTLPVGDVIAKLGEGGGAAETAEDEGDDANESGDEDSGGGERAETEQDDTEAGDRDQADAEEGTEDEGGDEDTGAGASDEQEGGEGGPAGDEEPDEAHGKKKVRASPVARRVAEDKGIDLSQVKGSGPGGRIVKADVQEPEEKKAAAPATKRDSATAKGETETQDLTRLQQTVARRMAESKATAPDFVLNIEVDMEAAVEFRKELKAAAGEGGRAPSFNDFVIKASALALREFPRANAAYRDGRFELYSAVNVGLAVAGQNALVVPTIFDADRKSLGTIATEARALAERVREGQITPPELSGGTFTVSNLGMYAIRRITPVINPPQAAILGVGSLEARAVVREGAIVARHTMDLTLVCDHRILYGADAAEFLSRIRERLEQPLQLVL